MSRIRYTEDFKRDAAAQVSERGHSIADVSDRLGVTTKSLYAWVKAYGRTPAQTSEQSELKRLKAELARVTEERDILKKATAYFARESK